MKTRLLLLPLLLLPLTVGCSARIQPQTMLDPCTRVRLDPAPLWTASAAWTPDEDRLLLIGPDRRSLLVYTLRGELERQVELDPVATLEYASPMRLEATEDGYVLGDKHQILWLDSSLARRRLWKPFEHLKAAGVTSGTISDFTVAGDTVYAFADYIQSNGAEASVDDWHRGFVRIDLDEPEIATLHEFAVEDVEHNAYYFYGQRPYVADLGRHAYVLRYSEPAQVLRASRKSLKPFYSGHPEDGFETHAIYAWKDHLYLLTSRQVEPEELKEVPSAKVVGGQSTHAQLVQAREVLSRAVEQRFLFQIEPKTGRTLARYRLPTEAQQVKLLPGEHFWALIEESSSPNMGGADETHLMLLPAQWLARRSSSAEAPEVVLQCPA